MSYELYRVEIDVNQKNKIGFPLSVILDDANNPLEIKVAIYPFFSVQYLERIYNLSINDEIITDDNKYKFLYNELNEFYIGVSVE